MTKPPSRLSPEDGPQPLSEIIPLVMPSQAQTKKPQPRRDGPGHTISITPGHWMRLSRRYSQVWIQFSEPPSEDVKQILNDHGWRFWQQHRAWTFDLDPQKPWQTHLQAEQFFTDLANSIRAEAGLPPVDAPTP